MMSARILFARLVRDEEGQDTIEYVLLTAGIGIVTIAIWPSIETAIRVSYQALDTNTQNLWEPDPPAGGGS
jgi:Flp pilus assembly pilin Flp